MAELGTAIECRTSVQDIVAEAADVANFAMMIADLARLNTRKKAK